MTQELNRIDRTIADLRAAEAALPAAMSHAITAAVAAREKIARAEVLDRADMDATFSALGGYISALRDASNQLLELGHAIDMVNDLQRGGLTTAAVVAT